MQKIFQNAKNISFGQNPFVFIENFILESLRAKTKITLKCLVLVLPLTDSYPNVPPQPQTHTKQAARGIFVNVSYIDNKHPTRHKKQQK